MWTKCDMQIADPPFSWTTYEASIKLMVIKYTTLTNNCMALSKCSFSQANVHGWKKDKEQLLGRSSTSKTFCWQKMGCYREMEGNLRLWSNKIFFPPQEMPHGKGVLLCLMSFTQVNMVCGMCVLIGNCY